MKFSESWLREWVNPDVSTSELVEQLTMAGLEVDAVSPVAGEFSGVVVGEILSVEPHPDAEKLRVCQVAGAPDKALQVVCGAPNARPGLKIPFALVGATLPMGEDGKKIAIKKAKLRGLESFGMLCSQTELQVGEDNAGLWELPAEAPTGTDITDYLKLRDNIIELDLTPNRGDCLSLKGLARETAVLNRLAVTGPKIPRVAETITDTVPVVLQAPERCARYVGRVIKNVDVGAVTPLWLQEKLRRSGLRSIDPIVDVTNYILLELGQPMHAFDLDKLQGGISVRMAGQNEKLVLLDDQEVALREDTLVIADTRGAIAMAGIMGGKATAVSSQTQNIFFESAFFDPLAIAGRARAYGLHTDSSHRYERGVDFSGAADAVERASALLLEIAGGQAGPVVVTETESLQSLRTVKLNKTRIREGLGVAIPEPEVIDILSRLGVKLIDETESNWSFQIPAYRFDIYHDVDLLEELARIYGYNEIPGNSVMIDAKLPLQPETVLSKQHMSQHLVTRGYQEAITYSFIEPKLQKLFQAETPAVSLLNPISEEMSVMRSSLIPGLVQTLLHNLKRQTQRVRLFEVGMTFVPAQEEEVQQENMLAGLLYGPRDGQAWQADSEWVDFYDIKGDVASLLEATGKEVQFRASTRHALHPGQTAEVFIQGQKVGVVGALHPAIAREMDIPKAVLVFELNMALAAEALLPVFKPLSKFPEVSRDLAILIKKDVIWEELEQEIITKAGNYLKNLKVFDVYSGEHIDPQRKSLAFSLTFQHPSRTLKEEEVTASISDIVQHLEVNFSVKLR